jgi:hypothetical protein
LKRLASVKGLAAPQSIAAARIQEEEACPGSR